MSFGWSGQILRVDLSNRKSWVEPTEPYTKSFIGGRGISVKVIYDEVEPEVLPFDPANRLCVGTGVLSGTLAPSSSRTKITTMSPNGLLANAGLGGFVGAEIKYAGYDNIVIEGKSDKPVYLYIHNDSIEFKDAGHIWGKSTEETEQIIKQEIGGVQIMCIGPGGENLVSFSSIRTGGSTAGRSGMGAIMGSKNLKAIAVKGTRGIKIAKMEEFLVACEQAHKELVENPAFSKGYGDALVGPIAWARNIGLFYFGNWEKDVSWGEEEKKYVDEYNITTNNNHCFGCPTGHPSMTDWPGIGHGVQDCAGWVCWYSPVWNPDHKIAYHACYLCDNYGLDHVATANIVSFLIELYHKGIITEKDTDGIAMRRGDGNAIISTIHKIGKQEGFSKLFRNGVLEAARTIGKGAEDCAMHVKGLEIQPLDVRAVKSQALCSAIATGAGIEDHSIIDYTWPLDNKRWEKRAEELYGTREAAVPTSYEKKAVMVWDHGNRNCAIDMLGVCKYVTPWNMPSLESTAKLFSLATGRDMSEDELLTAAERTKTLERAFNVTKGVRRKDDTLPERMFENTVQGGVHKGANLEKQKFSEMINEYYALRGWDEDGIPTEEAFEKFGLSSEWKAFKKKLGKEVIFHV